MKVQMTAILLIFGSMAWADTNPGEKLRVDAEFVMTGGMDANIRMSKDAVTLLGDRAITPEAIAQLRDQVRVADASCSKDKPRVISPAAATIYLQLCAAVGIKPSVPYSTTTNSGK